MLKGLGINDDLNGTERPVTFPIKDLGDAQAEVVHSLAKWKRLTLAEYDIQPGYGIYTDMNAIRADEELDNLHSLYVDQWDWEAVIQREDRTIAFLRNVVERIYAAIRRTEYLACETYPQAQAVPATADTLHTQRRAAADVPHADTQGARGRDMQEVGSGICHRHRRKVGRWKEARRSGARLR